MTCYKWLDKPSPEVAESKGSTIESEFFEEIFDIRPLVNIITDSPDVHPAYWGVTEYHTPEDQIERDRRGKKVLKKYFDVHELDCGKYL